MRFGWMTSAALSLGISAVGPTLARADHLGDTRAYERPPAHDFHGDRDYDRSDNDRFARDHCDVHNIDAFVELRAVPRCVLDQADREGNGRHVTSVRYIRHDGRAEYVVRMERARKDDLVLRFTPEGRVIDIDRQAR